MNYSHQQSQAIAHFGSIKKNINLMKTSFQLSCLRSNSSPKASILIDSARAHSIDNCKALGHFYGDVVYVILGQCHKT